MTPADGTPAPADGFRQKPLCLLAVAVVVIGQVGFALTLFDSHRNWAAVADDRPLTDGRHPLHLYHGAMGAECFRQHGSTCGFDPYFQAGYPKTPVFDAGSRPAELFHLLFARSAHDPAAYKLGVLIVCAVVPVVLAAAARGFGVSAGGACWAAIGGCILWWTPGVRSLLDAGQLDLLLVGMAIVLFLGGMVRYGKEPGVTPWLMMAAASVVGWFAHPACWLGSLPLVAAWYLINAPRHGLAWHLGAIAVLPVGVVPNLVWLGDWSRFWWVRRGTMTDAVPPPCLRTYLGDLSDYLPFLPPNALGWGLAILGAAGLIYMVRRSNACGAMLLTLAAVAAVATARLGQSWLPATEDGADRAAALVPFFAVLAAAFALGEVLRPMKLGPYVTGIAVGVVALCGWFDPPFASVLPEFVPRIAPLRLGLTPGQERMVEAIRTSTTKDARILIEEPDNSRGGWNWTALLPTLTDRYCLGGLDVQAGVDHAYCGMHAGRLLGRPFAEWTADDRAEFCRKYNVGWVLVHSPEAVTWWTGEPGGSVLGRFDDDGQSWTLIELARDRTFVLSGTATIERLDRHRIVLTDLKPDAEGFVSLSLHYQRDLRAAPIAQVFPARDLNDPIPFLKLYLPGTVSRVTLTWEQP